MLRIVAAAVVVGVLAASSACTSDSDPDDEASAPLTEITVECEEYADAADRIAEAQAALYSGEDDAALDTLVAELEALEEGAPADVRESLSELSDGFRSAQELLANPTEENRQQLAELAPELAENSEQVTDYIVDECQA